MENRKKKILMLCVLLLGCVLTGLWSHEENNKRNGNNVKQLIAVSKEEMEKQNNRPMKIYVSGAVLMPGIYDVSLGARAYDAVAAAGGMTSEADADKVKLAKKLRDGDHVNVPFVKQGRIKSHGAAGADRGSKAVVTVSRQQNNLININTASQKELDSLPGIGPAMAKRIIAEREKNTFASVDDLLRVKGIGPAKLAKLRSRVRVD